ncbi:MAG: hypothetical protein ACREVZ_14440 [Burkholderiales bacterium]
MPARLAPGDLIRDNLGRECVVLERAKQPDKKWLAFQDDERMRKVRTRVWWHAMPLDGGGIIVPEVLATFIRHIALDDALTIIAADKDDYYAMVRLFPELESMGLEPT